MKKDNLVVIIALALTIAIGSTFILSLQQNAQAQVDPNDRFFQKDFCQAEQTILDDITYNTGNPISYDSQGCPISLKVIHGWNDISPTKQILITNRMTTNGYTDVTSTMQALIQ